MAASSHQNSLGLLGAERIGKVESTGIGGRVEATAVKLDSFTVGPATINDVAVVARNDDIGKKLAPPGKKLSGILGNDLLMHCVIEYEHQKKHLFPFITQKLTGCQKGTGNRSR